jgi:tRNA (cytidine/uridine-2'-O-)-methyltransferase
VRIALYQPDIPQNTGALLRLGACFGVPVDIIEPCGFPLDDKRLRRAGMDYAEACELSRHSSWNAFLDGFRAKNSGRIILLTTKAPKSFAKFDFGENDVILLGRESAGAPPEVHSACDERLCVPLAEGARSLNVVTAAAIVLSEALRQNGFFYK